MGGESYTCRSADVLVNELGSMDLDALTTAISLNELGSIDLDIGLESTEFGISHASFRGLESVKLETLDSFIECCLEDCAVGQSGK